MRSTLIALIILLTTLIPGITAAQQVHTYVSTDSARVGDVIDFVLVIDRGQNHRNIILPDDSVFGEEFEITGRDRFRVAATRDSLVYRLQFFALEDTRLPRLEITFTGGAADTTIRTLAIPVLFKSALDDDEDFKPFKPIFEFAAAIWFYLITLFLLMIAGWYFYKYLKNREKVSAIPATPYKRQPFINPVIELEKELFRLSGDANPAKTGDFDKFYVELGDAIRSYFEEVYKIDALEMTSREILNELRQYPADQGIITITRTVLQEADMVKFARFEPGIAQSKKALELGLEFLNTVRTLDNGRIESMRLQHEEAENQKLMNYNKINESDDLE
jgi:hypothetical protein